MHSENASRAFVWVLITVLLSPLNAGLSAADLHPQTVAAFNRYVTLTEAQLQSNAPFLRIDRLPDARRQQARDQMRKNELVIERLETKDGTRDIDVPDGMIHHWIGTAFV